MLSLSAYKDINIRKFTSTFTQIKASELRVLLQEALGRCIQPHGHWCPAWPG